MREDEKESLQEVLSGDSDFLIADDTQVANMQREYAVLGLVGGKNESRLCEYPLPVYMKDNCFEFCKCAKESVVILSGLDKIFVSRNQKVIDFLIKSLGKNCASIAIKGDITQEIFLPEQRMPIKQSMYRLLELHNFMSIALDELCVYDKSVSMGETVVRHLLLGSVLHGLCI